MTDLDSKGMAKAQPGRAKVDIEVRRFAVGRESAGGRG